MPRGGTQNYRYVCPRPGDIVYRALRELDDWFTYDEAALKVLSWLPSEPVNFRGFRAYVSRVLRDFCERGLVELEREGAHPLRYRWRPDAPA